MTNVPERIRKIWTDMYKLFDRYYLMENTEESWQAFWADAHKLREESGFNKQITEACFLISDYIATRMKAEIEAQNAV